MFKGENRKLSRRALGCFPISSSFLVPEAVTATFGPSLEPSSDNRPISHTQSWMNALSCKDPATSTHAQQPIPHEARVFLTKVTRPKSEPRARATFPKFLRVVACPKNSARLGNQGESRNERRKSWSRLEGVRVEWGEDYKQTTRAVRVEECCGRLATGERPSEQSECDEEKGSGYVFLSCW